MPTSSVELCIGADAGRAEPKGSGFQGARASQGLGSPPAGDETHTDVGKGQMEG